MGKLSQFFEGLTVPLWRYEELPMEDAAPPDVDPSKFSFSNLQARLFIKAINDTTLKVDSTFLELFHVQVIRQAVYLSKKTLESTDAKKTDWNYFKSKRRYMSIIDYLYHKENP